MTGPQLIDAMALSVPLAGASSILIFYVLHSFCCSIRLRPARREEIATKFATSRALPLSHGRDAG